MMYRVLPIRPSADLVERMLSVLCFAFGVFTSTLLVVTLTGVSFGLHGVSSVPIVAVTEDEQHAGFITTGIAVSTFMLTGYNGVLPALFPFETWLLNFLPNALPTRLLIYHLIDVDQATAIELSRATLPTNAAYLGLLFGYAVVCLGVGKSVLLSCLAGSELLSSGRVEVCGVAQAGREGVAGFLLQEAMCIDRLTGRETVAFYARLHPRFTDAWREYTDRLDLDKRVETYSDGMKRKLELVITLSIDVPVYFLDEPTAGLDLSAIQAVHAILREQRAAGKTIVVASHLPMDAGLADRIAFLQGGRSSLRTHQRHCWRRFPR